MKAAETGVDAMTSAVTIDEKSRMPRFWLRTLLAIGMLWGFLPFVMAPFITKGPSDTIFDIFASIFNSLTVLPACIFALWHRRIACIWLSIDSVLLLIAVTTFIRRTGKFELAMILEVAVPIAIALCLDFMEARRWPGAVDASKAKSRQG
jgi:thiamine transporter ThiT